MNDYKAGDRVRVARDKSGAGYDGQIGTVVRIAEVWCAPDDVQVQLDHNDEVQGFDADELELIAKGGQEFWLSVAGRLDYDEDAGTIYRGDVLIAHINEHDDGHLLAAAHNLLPTVADLIRERDALRARLAAIAEALAPALEADQGATGAPWDAVEDRTGHYGVIANNRIVADAWPRGGSEARLIVALRNALPAVRAELEKGAPDA